MSDLATIEDRLRRTYQAVADTTVVTHDALPDRTSDPHVIDLDRDDGATGRLDGAVVELFDHRAGSRRHFLLSAAAIVTVAALGAVAVAVGGGTDQPTAQTGAPSAPGWTPIADPPFEPRQASSAVWTGSEVIVFGGFVDNADSGVPGEGAAAYDPATDTWREIAEPPEQLRGEAITAWTGEVVVALPVPIGLDTDTGIGEQPGATYDPATDEWHEIPVSGIGVVHWGSQMFWTGDRIVVAGMFDPADPTKAMVRAATYDPATGVWERLDDSPILIGQASGVERPGAVWTGEELLYVGIAIDDPGEMPAEGSLELPGDRYAALSLDPTTGTWEELAPPPLAVRLNLSVAWTGQELFVGGGTSLEEEAMSDAVTYDPASGAWQPLPEAPAEIQPNYNDGGDAGSASLVGGRLVLFDAVYPNDRPVVLDPATRTWSLGEAHPARVYLASTVSIGDGVLVLGGNDQETYGAFAGGYVYTP